MEKYGNPPERRCPPWFAPKVGLTVAKTQQPYLFNIYSWIQLWESLARAFTIFDRCIICNDFHLPNIIKHQKHHMECFNGIFNILDPTQSQNYISLRNELGQRASFNNLPEGLRLVGATITNQTEYNWLCKIKSQALARVSCPVETCWNMLKHVETTYRVHSLSSIGGRPAPPASVLKKGKKAAMNKVLTSGDGAAGWNEPVVDLLSFLQATTGLKYNHKNCNTWTNWDNDFQYKKQQLQSLESFESGVSWKPCQFHSSLPLSPNRKHCHFLYANIL